MTFCPGSSVSFIIPRSVDSSYVIGLGQTVSSLDWKSGNTAVLCGVDQGNETRFNDAKCDASGRLWAGEPSANYTVFIKQPWYYFAMVTILTLLSYTEMVLYAAIRGSFAAKNSPKCFCGQGSFCNSIGDAKRAPQTHNRLGRVMPPIPHPFASSSASQFSASLAPWLSALEHAALVLIIKGRRSACVLNIVYIQT